MKLGSWFLLATLIGSSLAHAAPFRIAFSSCNHQDREQSLWNTIKTHNPQVFLFIGDNIYGDSNDPAVLRRKYQQLADSPAYQDFRTSIPILATWDDHDYGRNDAGREFEAKVASQEAFLDFFGVPKDSPRRKQEGVYYSEIKSWEGLTVQFILLDTRSFRSPLLRAAKSKDYVPDLSPQATMLGDAQWNWLEQELRKRADVRIIASSIQFLSAEHPYEKWANFPLERQRMLDLISKTRAEGVVFISGDRHLGELSVLRSLSTPYPLFDFTASGMTESLEDTINPERNSLRLAETRAHSTRQYGLIELDKAEGGVQVSLRLLDGRGKALESTTIPLEQLRHPKLSQRH